MGGAVVHVDNNYQIRVKDSIREYKLMIPIDRIVPHYCPPACQSLRAGLGTFGMAFALLLTCL